MEVFVKKTGESREAHMMVPQGLVIRAYHLLQSSLWDMVDLLVTCATLKVMRLFPQPSECRHFKKDSLTFNEVN